MVFISELVELGHSKDFESQLFADGTDAKPAIEFPPPVTEKSEERVNNFL